MSNIWNKEAECMSAEERRQLQSARLVDAVRRVYDNVPFYRKKMQDLGLTPDDIHGIEDLSKLPFTTKADLRDSYPFEAFAVPREQIVRIHASSGTTGNPTIVGVTKNDITVWAECMARSLAMAGATRKDVVQVSYGYGLFTGGLGAHYGSEYLGALTIPTSGGNTSRQVKLMKDLGTDILCCTPSYALFLYDAMKEAGIDPHKDLKLRAGVFGAEPWTQEMREEIESKLGIEAFDVYGLSEIMGPGVSMSCNVEPGLHVQEDHFLPEIINPETCEVLPDGETGELVFTCITKEALPLIRYRTRDLSSLDHTPCACGRTTVRMSRVKGRSDDMLIIRGVNVFPSQVESVLLSVGQVNPHYMLYVDRENNLDKLSIEVEMSDELFSDKVENIQKIQRQITAKINSVLNINAEVRLVAPKTIPRSEGKAKRVIDNRKK